jgi:hypothetical protein
MFGMLDYRAHKLLWLIFLPIRLCIWVSYFANIFVSVLFANSLHYSLPIKVIAGYVVFEIIGMLLLAFWTFVNWIIQKAFFWIIDVVPSDGENAEEARTVVLMGPIFRLSRKAGRDIGNMTIEEMMEFSRRANGLLGRILFKAHDRVGKRLFILFQHHMSTGKQPEELTPQEIKSLVGHLEFSKFEKLVAYPAYMRSAVAFIVIAVSLTLLNS